MSYTRWHGGLHRLYSTYEVVCYYAWITLESNDRSKAPGLSLLPLSMIKGRRSVDTEKEDINSRIAVNRERQREIQARYSGTAKPKSMNDRHDLDRLEDERR